MEFGISTALKQMFENVKRLEPHKLQFWTSRLIARLSKNKADILNTPRGPTRAKVIHHKVQRALDRHWEKYPDQKASVSCFKCTMSGCCHTNVDITEDEAKLLADKIRNGLKIDYLLLNRQAAVSDGLDKIDAWRLLSFEERACVFLKDGRCQVYEDRPFSCRKWFVMQDPLNCNDYEGGGLIRIVEEAEIVASAAFSLNRSGRLPNMIQEELKRGTNNT